jgi:ribonuclease J
LKNVAVYHPNKPFEAAGFKVTPYPVDHAAFDSYALLVEADGKKVFYTGDFRQSGYAAYKTENLLKKPPKEVDALLMEGTVVGSDSHENTPEKDLPDKITDAIQSTDTGLVFLAASSQNIDRLVTAMKSANKLKRTFVIDNYAYSILKATELKSIIGALSRIKVFIPKYQRIMIKKNKLFDKLPPPYNRVYEEELLRNQEKYILLYRHAHIELFRNAELRNPLLIYSMWIGYFDENEALKNFMADKGIRYEHIHTSGHADMNALKRFADTVKPKMLIPVHTEHPLFFKELYDNVNAVREVEL